MSVISEPKMTQHKRKHKLYVCVCVDGHKRDCAFPHAPIHEVPTSQVILQFTRTTGSATATNVVQM